MKKILVSILACMLFGYYANAQGSFIEGAFGFTLDNSLEDESLQVKNFNLGFSTAIIGNLYFGATIGYSMVDADNPHNNLKPYTLTPKLTLDARLGHSSLHWTPNIYATLGYASESLDELLNQDLGKVNYYNCRLGFNLLSFDYFLGRAFSINITALTPYYNIMKTSYSNKDHQNLNFDIDDYSGLAYIGGMVGLKVWF